MSRFTTLTNASGAVASGTDFDFDLTITSNTVNLGKVKVVPSAAIKGYVLKIYKKATRLLVDLHYSTRDPKVGNTYDPTDRNGNEILQGFVLPYEDLDAGKKIHCRIHNYDAVARSYTTSIDFEDFMSSILGTTVPAEAITFTGTAGSLSRAAVSASAIRLYRNGVRLRQGSSNDYTVAANQNMTLHFAASGDDYFEADYF